MLEKLNASQIALGHREITKLVDLDRQRGWEYTDTYQRLGLFSDRNTTAASLIGTLALAHLGKAGVEMGMVAPRISPIIYAGLMYIAVDHHAWKYLGSDPEVDQLRDWLEGGTDQIRRRRVEELLQIQERPANRFLSVTTDLRIATFDDAVVMFQEPQHPLLALVDARWLADHVRAGCPDKLFSLELKK